MPVVTSTEKDPAGVAVADAEVHIRLVTTTTGAAGAGYVLASDHTILGEWTTRTDASGVWSATLVANSLITPSGTVYTAEVKPRQGHAVRHTISVPNGAGPYRVEDILSDPPATLASPASVALSTIDAKGDLLVGTADSTLSRLAVGTNAFVLTADSAEATGLKWAAAAGGVPIVATQAGSTAAGTPLRLMTITPASPGASKFVWEIGGASFGGVEDSVSYWGWNGTSGGNRLDTSRARVGLILEDQFNDAGVDTCEAYIEFMDTTGAFSTRPFMFQFRRTPGSANAILKQSIFRGNPIQFQLPDQSTVIGQWAEGAVIMNGATGITLELSTVSGIPQLIGKQNAITFFTLLASNRNTCQLQVDSRTTVVVESFSSYQQLTVGSTGSLGVVGANLTSMTAGGICGFESRLPASPVASHNHQLWSNNSVIQSRIDRNGYFMTRKVAAPADGDLVASELAIWFDSTNGAAKIKFKAKEAGGTVRTGEVALA